MYRINLINLPTLVVSFSSPQGVLSIEEPTVRKMTDLRQISVVSHICISKKVTISLVASTPSLGTLVLVFLG